MTTLLPANLSPFGHHPYKSNALQVIRPRSLTSSSYTSISLPVLCFDAVESVPLKPSGSLPDLSIMVSATTEKRHRTSSLNDTFHLSSASTSTPKEVSNETLFCQKTETPVGTTPTDSTMTISQSSQSLSSGILPSSNVEDLNNNGAFSTKRDVGSSGENTPREPASPAMSRRRKNSSMTPVLPDLELMAKLQQEDDQRNAQLASAISNGLTNGHHSEAEKAEIGEHADLDAHDQTANGYSSHLKEWQQYGGSEKESAAAWLAAATKRSPQTRRKNGMVNYNGNGIATSPVNANSNLKSCCAEISKPSYPPVITITSAEPPKVTASTPDNNRISSRSLSACNSPAETKGQLTSSVSLPLNASIASIVTPSVEKPKPLQPFGKNDRVRRTSILRPPSTFVASSLATTCPKKKVSFADTMGKQLESVRYFVITPQVQRRYSSYTAPTAAYLTNGNYISPWNMAISGNANRKPLDMNTSHTAAPSVQAESVKDYDFSHAKLAPRYELVASNFTSPSLQLNFNQHLDAQSVLLHSVTTAETTVYGTVSVLNLHYSKKIVIRYTYDDWSSFIEREATYMLGSHDGHSDKFSFVIYARPDDFANNLATTFSAHQSSTYLASSRATIQSIHPRLYFAIRFITGDGREFWDNNDGRNYCLNLTAY